MNKGTSTLALGGALSIGNAANPGVAGSAVVQLNNSDTLGSATNLTVYSDGLFNLNIMWPASAL